MHPCISRIRHAIPCHAMEDAVLMQYRTPRETAHHQSMRQAASGKMRYGGADGPGSRTGLITSESVGAARRRHRQHRRHRQGFDAIRRAMTTNLGVGVRGASTAGGIGRGLLPIATRAWAAVPGTARVLLSGYRRRDAPPILANVIAGRHRVPSIHIGAPIASRILSLSQEPKCIS